MIAQCPGGCKSNHDYQDQKYGKGYRLMNEVYVNGKLAGARCTVCAVPKEHSKKRAFIPIEALKVRA